jgi:exopolysaccharide production protein ExoY
LLVRRARANDTGLLELAVVTAELARDPSALAVGADAGASAGVELLPDRPSVGDRSRAELALQRLLDICISISVILVGLLPGLAIAAVVKATSTGPAFFLQERVGRNREIFRVVKFRTMKDGTHLEVRNDPALLAEYQANDFKLSPDDPRITTIGRWLRRTSLDELPQLINVLRGEMSIVGVRPVLLEELALRPGYDQDLYSSRRPGMTGLWQVEGRSSVQREDRLHLDRRYLETWSVWGDAKILLRTPAALLRMSHAH